MIECFSPTFRSTIKVEIDGSDGEIGICIERDVTCNLTPYYVVFAIVEEVD